MDPDDGATSVEDPTSDASTGVAAPAPRTEPPEPDAEADERERWSVRSRRLALYVFIAYLVVAFFVLLLHHGDGRWFNDDEWGFLDGRRLTDPIGLLRSQNGHWSTFPIIVYLVLYRLFGLRSYLPYVGGTIVLHLSLASLLRVVMRRSGVGPWVATLVAGTFVLYGVGYENILLGVQISMVSSMVFGVAQWLLADHDGPIGRRDVLALGAGLIAITASTIGLPMVVAVGLATFIRRGWRPALVQTGPLAAVYLVWVAWQVTVGDFGTSEQLGTRDVVAFARWVGSSETGVLVGIGQYTVVAVALGVVLVGGLVLAWGPMDRATFRRLAAGPAGLLLGGIVLSAMIGFQRAQLSADLGVDLSRTSRYVAMGTAMALPALAVAAAAIIRRWRITAPVIVALFLIGVPGNIDSLSTAEGVYGAGFFENQERFVVGVADSPIAEEVDPGVFPDPSELSTANLTVGFILQARRDGRLPDPVELTPAEADRITVRLTMAQGSVDDDTPAHTCEQHDGLIVVDVEAGDRFVITGPTAISVERPDGTSTLPSTYSTSWSGPVITAQLPATIAVGPPFGATSFEWCTVD